MKYYKDSSPDDTFKRIYDSLNKIGVIVEEKWIDSGITDIFSLRINISGTSIGTNGKGTTKEYARASAYAEMIERLSNFILIRINYWKYIEKYPDAVEKPVEDFLSTGFSFPEYSSKALIDTVNHIFNDDNNTVWSVPVKNIITDEIKMMPSFFLPFFGSNGMGAGNTYEEFAVQAISEIFERYSVKMIIQGIKNAPIIKREKIKDLYPKLCMIADEIESKGAKVFIRDCSIGMNLPVFAVVILKEDNSFSIAFGSHPHFEYAIERCFTEALQGQNIKNLKNNANHFSGSDYYNLLSIYKIGCGTYPEYLFCDNKETDDYWFLYNNFKSNAEMYRYYISILERNNMSAYYLDNSYLGLSSGQFFIPGISDVFMPDDKHFKYLETGKMVTQRFNDYDNQDDKVKKLILEYYEYMLKNNILEKDIEYVSDLNIPSNLTLIIALGIKNICHGNNERGRKYLEFVNEKLEYNNNNEERIHHEIKNLLNNLCLETVKRSSFYDANYTRRLSDSEFREELFKKLLNLKRSKALK